MTEQAFILSILKAIEKLQDGVVAYAYKDGNSTGSIKWWTICVSDYDFYFGNDKFHALEKVWHEAAVRKGTIVSFAYCLPLEKRLIQLLNQNNLIMNIETAE